ncbi:hypothetical protein KAU18_05670 [Candidatus Bathyarchaeota archaeon]|nr:hypothetical protein [Candidatus Bathyarchaeota archaeon]
MLTPTELGISFLGMIAFLLLMLGFAMMVAGIGELVDRTRTFLASSLSIILIPLIQFMLGREWVPLVMIVALAPYLFMVLSLIVIDWKFGVEVKLQIAGWLNLFFVNLGFITGLVDPGFTDLTSIMAKIVIYLGMTQPKFSFLADDLRLFLIGGVPEEYANRVEGKFTMISQSNTVKEKDIQWIKERLLNNSKKGIRTLLITMYDLITPDDIYDKDTTDELYFVRVLLGNRSILRTFEDRIMSINDDLNQIDILFSDVISYSKERTIPCEIILYTLSHLIHTHGWRRVYSFITSKNPVIKSSQVQFTCFYDSRSHEDRSEIIKFENLADSVVSV